jgi:hypothetical protein
MKTRSLSHLSSLILLVLLLASSACKSQKTTQKPDKKSPKGQPELPAELVAAYKEDAHRIALRELQSQKTVTGEMEARIPQERVDYFYDKLVKSYAIWMKSDSIEDLTHIHTFGNPDMRTIRLVVAPESPYLKTWSQYNEVTENLYINQLVSKYGLEITEYKTTTLGPTVYMRSAGFINTPELCYILANFEGIKFVEPEGKAGDGDDIEVTSTAKTGRILRFSIGAGDCPSGCIHRKYWNFLLEDSGNVRYIGIEGEIPSGTDK